MSKMHPGTRLRVVLAGVLGLALLLAAQPALGKRAPADPAVVGYPNAIASTGDSITRAFNTGTLPFTDAPANSWSTGTNNTVLPHYLRILAVMYLRTPIKPLDKGRSIPSLAALWICALVTLVFGIAPETLSQATQEAAHPLPSIPPNGASGP